MSTLSVTYIVIAVVMSLAFTFIIFGIHAVLGGTKMQKDIDPLLFLALFTAFIGILTWSSFFYQQGLRDGAEGVAKGIYEVSYKTDTNGRVTDTIVDFN